MSLFLAKLHNQEQSAIVFNSGAELAKVASLYRVPANITEIQFERENPTLENGEWFVVSPDIEMQSTMFAHYHTYGDATADLNGITQTDYKSIDVLYLVQEGITFFTKITPKLRVTSRNYLVFDGEPKMHEQKNAVHFEARIDAFWKSGNLYFRKYETIKSMFPGIDALYRTATENEVVSFLQQPDFFEIDAGLNAESIGDRNRKRIAEILDSKKDFNDSNTRVEYLDYARKYSPEVVSGEKFAMKTNADVTKVLHALDERYYTTPFSQEKREVYVSKKIT